jgi:hypothetical protein
MRLKDLERRKTGLYVGTLTDAAGDAHYELAISGPQKLIEQGFAKSDFEYGIEPKASQDDWSARFEEVWTRAPGPARTVSSTGRRAAPGGMSSAPSAVPSIA